MLLRSSPAIDVVSPKVYGLIVDSASLRERLLPDGLIGSPYEILDYQATLVLTDPTGQRATFHRTQRIRFLQHGVAAILDHFWGDGVTLTDYRNTAGAIGDSFKDAGRHHLVIDLPRAMRRGETLIFEVERTAMAAFTADHEWLETTIDHPVRRLTRTIIFPHERPCLQAVLVGDGELRELQPTTLPDGRTMLCVQILVPKPDQPYVIHWSW